MKICLIHKFSSKKKKNQFNDIESSFNNLNINELFESDSYKYNEYNNKSFVCNSKESFLNEDYNNLKNK